MAKTPEFDPRKPRKNYFINGDMSIAQRGTSFAAVANQAYTLDRFQYIKVGAMVHTITQDTDVPTLAESGYLFQNSLRMNLTTPDTAIAAGDYCGVGQIVEGNNWKNLAQKPFTISFWVKATVAGTYCLGLQNSAADRGYAAEYTIDAANTWEYKTVTIPASVSAGTWNYTNGVGLKVWWMLAVGSTFQFASGSWQTGTVLGTANQVNGVNTGATDFRITGVVINEGSDALAFKLYGEDIVDEVAACQRYYEKSYDLNINPGTLTLNGGHVWHGNGVSNRPFTTIYFRVTKRAAPSSIATYNPQAANSNIRDTDSGGELVPNVGRSNTNSFAINPSGVPLSTAVLQVNWAVESELS